MGYDRDVGPGGAGVVMALTRSAQPPNRKAARGSRGAAGAGSHTLVSHQLPPDGTTAECRMQSSMSPSTREKVRHQGSGVSTPGGFSFLVQ